MSGVADRGARTVRLGAKIICNERSSIFDCVVRSLSGTGAKIEMSSTLGVPRSFHLRIKPSSREYECELVSRSENQLTVSFGFEQHIIGEPRLSDGARLAVPRSRVRSPMSPRLR